MQVIRQPKPTTSASSDPGAGGGMAAKVLVRSRRRRRDARGRRHVGRRQGLEDVGVGRTIRRAAAPRTPTKPFGEFDGCIGGWDLDGEPYTQAAGITFDWFRGRMLGGRTNHWGRISLRMGPDDFRRPQPRRPRRRLADRLRRHQAVLRQARSSGRHLRIDGRHPERTRRRVSAAAQAALLRAADQTGGRQAAHHVHPVTPVDSHAGRSTAAPPCHYCGQCGRGCATHSNFSSPSVLLPPALATGQAAHHHQRDGARSDSPTSSGLATGVSLRQHERIAATTPCARASSCSRRARARSARLLLNSKSGRFPDGLANSSGVVGRYLTDSTGLARQRPHPEDGRTACAHNEDGAGGAHLYMPWWLDNRSSISRAATTSSSAAAGGCAELRLHGRHPALQRRRRLRQVAEGRLPALLRRDASTSPAAAR